MTLVRAYSILVAVACTASAAPNATLAIQQTTASPQKYSCTIAIFGVDGHPFKSLQQQITLSPGRHLVVLRVVDAHGKVYDTEGLPIVYKPGHHYSARAWFTNEDKAKIDINDETADAQQRKRK
jgi:hypothetical protein